MYTPFLPVVNPCELHCRPVSEYFSEKMLDAVTDGTPCFINNKSRNICVNGVCKVVDRGCVGLLLNATLRRVYLCSVCRQEVGCDFGIDSNAVEDRCGVCLGDGTSCETVYNLFDEGEGFGEYKACWSGWKLTEIFKS